MPLTTLASSPFSLTYGSSVIVRVQAMNIIGYSSWSYGSGAIMVTTPDAPLNVVEVITVRTATTITLSWN